MSRTINLIFARSINNVIGDKGDLPKWNLPGDLKRFKELTMGHVVLMGRKTWESLPEKFRPLPGRTNIVLTSNLNYKAEGATVYNDVYDALREVYDRDIWVIGGAEIYKALMRLADFAFVTTLHKVMEGDTKIEFPGSVLKGHIPPQSQEISKTYMDGEEYVVTYETYNLKDPLCLA